MLPDRTEELVAVSTEGEDKGFKTILPNAMPPDADKFFGVVAWGGNGNQILICLSMKRIVQYPLFVFDFGGRQHPRVFPGYPKDFYSCDMVWSSDGKKVLFAAQAP
jgi:hypothetical protein